MSEPVDPDHAATVADDGRSRCPWAARPGPLREYHDTEWGAPVHEEAALFERLTLEAFQSGLSWAIILAKRPGFRRAFDDFAADRVARYDEPRVARLLTDPGIVRNRRKIEATVRNAQALVELREHRSLDDLVWSFRPEQTPAPRSPAEVPGRSPESAAMSKELKRHGFVFVGPTTMHALMEAVGVVDTHLVGCFRRGASGVWPASG